MSTQQPSSRPNGRSLADLPKGGATRRACPKCGKATAAEIILQARSVERKPLKTFATRARRLCEPCAVHAFDQMEAALDAPMCHA